MASIAGLCTFLILINVHSFRAVTGTRCYDAAAEENISYARMCSDDQVTSHQIILDTHEAKSEANERCICKVYQTYYPNDLQFLNIKRFGNGSNPNMSHCGSDVRLHSRNNEHIINCTSFPSISTYVAPMDIIWTKLFEGDSKYCLEIKSTIPDDALITISCASHQQTTTIRLPQCVSGSEEVRELDQIVSTTHPTVSGIETETRCVSVEIIILALVFGYLPAVVVVVGTMIYYRRKNIQLEGKLKNIAEDGHGTLSTMSTDILSVNIGSTDSSSGSRATDCNAGSGAVGPSPVSELHTGMVNIYDEIDTTAIRQSEIYLEPVSSNE